MWHPLYRRRSPRPYRPSTAPPSKPSRTRQFSAAADAVRSGRRAVSAPPAGRRETPVRGMSTTGSERREVRLKGEPRLRTANEVSREPNDRGAQSAGEACGRRGAVEDRTASDRRERAAFFVQVFRGVVADRREATQRRKRWAREARGRCGVVRGGSGLSFAPGVAVDGSAGGRQMKPKPRSKSRLQPKSRRRTKPRRETSIRVSATRTSPAAVRRRPRSRPSRPRSRASRR